MTALELKLYLETKLGIKHVYYQPPENFKLDYPCIVYTYKGIDIKKADNKNYIKYDTYQIQLMDSDVNSKFVDRIIELPYCRTLNFFTNDNINHWTYFLYTLHKEENKRCQD